MRPRVRQRLSQKLQRNPFSLQTKVITFQVLRALCVSSRMQVGLSLKRCCSLHPPGGNPSSCIGSLHLAAMTGWHTSIEDCPRIPLFTTDHNCGITVNIYIYNSSWEPDLSINCSCLLMAQCPFYCLNVRIVLRGVARHPGPPEKMSVCLLISLSAYVSICLSAYLSMCLTICLPTCLSAYMSICLSACLIVFNMNISFLEGSFQQ